MIKIDKRQKYSLEEIYSKIKEHKQGITTTQLAKELSCARETIAKYVFVLTYTKQIQIKKFGNVKVYFI